MVAFLPNITRPVHGLLASSALSITRWIRGRKKGGRPPYTDSTFGFSVAAEPRLCCGNPAASPHWSTMPVRPAKYAGVSGFHPHRNKALYKSPPVLYQPGLGILGAQLSCR